MLPPGMINIELYAGGEVTEADPEPQPIFVGAMIGIPPMCGDALQLMNGSEIVGGNTKAQVFRVLSRTFMAHNRAAGFPDEMCVMCRLQVEATSPVIEIDARGTEASQVKLDVVPDINISDLD